MARIAIVGTGVFGRLAEAVAWERGHETIPMSRRHPTTPVNADDVRDVARVLDEVEAEAVLLAYGPYQERPPSVAQAAARYHIPYTDLSDEEPFAQRVASVQADIPLLPGMSTTPAVVESLAAAALARVAPEVSGGAGPLTARAVLFAGGGNQQGPATLRFAVHARRPGKGVRVHLPGIGVKIAFPAAGHFRPDLPGQFFVAVGGWAALGWRIMPLVSGLAPVAARMPRLSRDTSTCILVDIMDQAGAVQAREALVRRRDGQRVSVLPAVWGLEEALAGRAPSGGHMPRHWVEPRRLLQALEDDGFQRTTEVSG